MSNSTKTKRSRKAGNSNKPPKPYGPTFKRPSKRVLRLHRNGNGPKMFEADEIHKLLAATGTQLRAMILLGVNCGFGNSDCGTLPLTALNLKNGWAKDTANPLSFEFRKLVKSLDLYRKGRSFYALRHTFETIAGEASGR